MSVDARQTAQERVCRPIGAVHEQDTTSNETGPQIGPEGTMESLAGLRAYVGRHARMDEMTKAALLVYAHEIEREVEDGWIRLPKDADGVPIHVGDVMEWVDIDGEVEVVCMVDAVGVGCFFAWDNANGRFAQKCANAYRHHHAPTVEDVLREFAMRTDQMPNDKSGIEPFNALVAEFAAKLRLAGDE